MTILYYKVTYAFLIRGDLRCRGLVSGAGGFRLIIFHSERGCLSLSIWVAMGREVVRAESAYRVSIGREWIVLIPFHLINWKGNVQRYGSWIG